MEAQRLELVPHSYALTIFVADGEDEWRGPKHEERVKSTEPAGDRPEDRRLADRLDKITAQIQKDSPEHRVLPPRDPPP